MDVPVTQARIFYMCVTYTRFFLSAEVTFERDHYSRLTKDEKSFNAPPWYRRAQESVLTPTPISTTSIKAKWAPGYEASTRDKYFHLIEVLTEVVVRDGRGSSRVKFEFVRYDRLNNPLLNKWLASLLSAEKLATPKLLKHDREPSWMNLRKFIY